MRDYARLALLFAAAGLLAACRSAETPRPQMASLGTDASGAPLLSPDSGKITEAPEIRRPGDDPADASLQPPAPER